VVDSAAYELPTDALLAGGYVRPGSGGGIALALRDALSGSIRATSSEMDVGAVEELTVADRQLLRSYLLQPIWFQQRGKAPSPLGGGGAGAVADPAASLAPILRQLPLYELANDGSFVAPAADSTGDDDSDPAADNQQPTQDGDGSSGAAAATAATAIFVPLQDGCAIAPQGVLWAALDERFINGGSPGSSLNTVLTTHLAVPAPSAPEVYRTCVLPRLAALAPALRDVAVVTMLRALSALEARDASFVRGLTQVAFVPNGAGALLSPTSLHDPRVPELLALLNPEAAFPCAELSSDATALAALQRLGLRGTAGEGVGCAFSGAAVLFSRLAVSPRCQPSAATPSLEPVLCSFVDTPPPSKPITTELSALVGAAHYIEATAQKLGGQEEAVARGRVRGAVVHTC